MGTRIRAQIDELFASQQDLGLVREEVARLSVRLVVQAALEAGVSEFLGRDRYRRGERERAGYRNGHTELTVKTTASWDGSHFRMHAGAPAEPVLAAWGAPARAARCWSAWRPARTRATIPGPASKSHP